MTVPFLDVGAAVAELRAEIDAAVARVLDSGWFVLGPEVEAFEAEWAAYVGARHCVGVGNGLDALHLVLRAWGIGPGDEVVVPSNTYIATWLAVTTTGATVVPVEPDATLNVDPAAVEAALTERTKALLPVHLYGQAADLAPLRDLARRHGLRILDDAAQAHGVTYGGARVGTGTDATAWSFYPGKNLGAVGDAGAVTTDDDDLADRLRALRNYGSRVKYVNDVAGYNSRLDPVQAAVLRAKLPYLDEWNARRAGVAAAYLDGLRGVTLPYVAPGRDHVWHLFVVRSTDRDGLRDHLRAHGVETLVHYPIPPHRQEAYAAAALGPYPVSEAVHDEVLSLPMGPHLSAEDVRTVVDAVNGFAG